MTAVSATPASQENQVIANFGVIAFTLAPRAHEDARIPRPTIFELRYLWDDEYHRFEVQEQPLLPAAYGQTPVWGHLPEHGLQFLGGGEVFIKLRESLFGGTDEAQETAKRITQQLRRIAERFGQKMATDLRQSVVATITIQTEPLQKITLTFTYKQSVDVTET